MLLVFQFVTTISWANVKGAAMAMHDPDNGVYGACLRGKPGWGDYMAPSLQLLQTLLVARWFDENMKPSFGFSCLE